MPVPPAVGLSVAHVFTFLSISLFSNAQCKYCELLKETFPIKVELPCLSLHPHDQYSLYLGQTTISTLQKVSVQPVFAYIWIKFHHIFLPSILAPSLPFLPPS